MIGDDGSRPALVWRRIQRPDRRELSLTVIRRSSVGQNTHASCCAGVRDGCVRDCVHRVAGDKILESHATGAWTGAEEPGRRHTGRRENSRTLVQEDTNATVGRAVRGLVSNDNVVLPVAIDVSNGDRYGISAYERVRPRAVNRRGPPVPLCGHRRGRRIDGPCKAIETEGIAPSHEARLEYAQGGSRS